MRHVRWMLRAGCMSSVASFLLSPSRAAPQSGPLGGLDAYVEQALREKRGIPLNFIHSVGLAQN